MANPLPTGGSQAPPPLPDVVFDHITDMTACSSGTISWSTVGDPAGLSLNVSNYGLDDGSVQPPPTQFYNLVIAPNVFPTLDMLTWSPVNVPQGNYYIVGSYDQTTVKSDTFFVANGTDVSCLVSPTPSPSPTDAGSSTSSSTPPTASPSGSGASLPISGALASSSNNHAGAIAGGVIGGVILIFLILLGLFFFLRSRRRTTRTKRSASESSGGAGRWNGLSSRDSNIQSAEAAYANASRKKTPKGIRRQSVEASSVGHGGNRTAMTSPIASDEDLSTLDEEEKIAHTGMVGSVYAAEPLSYTNTAPHGQKTHRRSSTNSTLNNPSPVSPVSPTRSRTGGSTTSQNRAATLAKLDAAGPYARRQSLDGRVLSSAPTSAVTQTPTTPVSGAEMIPMNVNRASSGPRRAARKPVPTYTPSDGDLAQHTAAMDRERSASSGGHSHGYQEHGLESATTLNTGGWKSREDLERSLSHKSSFGDGRPVHYLIPDMPPPPRDD